MIHVRHAAAAIASGLCETVLIMHGESGRSGVGRTRNVVAPTSLAGQFAKGVAPEIKFAGDSLLEGDGFEPSVPRRIFWLPPSIPVI